MEVLSFLVERILDINALTRSTVKALIRNRVKDKSQAFR